MQQADIERLGHKVSELPFGKFYSSTQVLPGLESFHANKLALEVKRSVAALRIKDNLVRAGEMDSLKETVSLLLRNEIRTPALREFGEKYSNSSAPECLTGFCEFLRTDMHIDLFYAEFLAAVDKDRYKDSIEKRRDGILVVKRFFRGCKSGTVTRDSFKYVESYWSGAQRELNERGTGKLEYEKAYLEAVRASSGPMKKALDYVRVNYL